MLRYSAVLILSPILFATVANSQSKTTATDSQQDRVISLERMMNNAASDSPEQRQQRERIMHVVAERRAQLQLDTEKLIVLASELKQQVDKSGINILSMNVIKKAQEIQKLAKSVQDKMKYAY